MGFSRQKYRSGLPCPPPRDLPDPGLEPGCPTLRADSLPSKPPGECEECQDEVIDLEVHTALKPLLDTWSLYLKLTLLFLLFHIGLTVISNFMITPLKKKKKGYLFIWLHQVLWYVGFFIVVRRHSSFRVWAPECEGSVVVAHGLSCTIVCGILVP